MGESTNLCCVKCNSILDKALFQGLEVDLCPKCGGLWLDRGEITRAAKLPEAELARLRGLLTGASGPPPIPTPNKAPCPACTGSGRAMSSRTIQARIPAGVADGQRIKLAGKGAPGERGCPAGDLYVRVHVKPHPVFGRSAANLTVTVPVTFAELTLGAEVKVPSHRGAPVTIRIPPGTPNRRTFTVRGSLSTASLM